MAWESDAGLLDTRKQVDGTLPGEGVTSYVIGIFEGKGDDFEQGRDFVKVLQEFRFRGGGDLRVDEVPPRVSQAFEKWFEKIRSP